MIDADLIRENIPEQMQHARRWLIWKFVPDEGKKPKKQPFYADGSPRSGTLDSPEDVARLADFDTALKAAVDRGYGLGFALGPDGTGNHWQGLDFDDVENNPGNHPLIDDLQGMTYTERSPSGNGWHAIGYGKHFVTSSQSKKHGIEFYAGGKYFTVTGDEAGIHAPIDLAGFVASCLVPIVGQDPSKAGNPENHAAVQTVSPETLRELRSALTALRADDRTEWINNGLALKTIGEAGRSLWLEWSQTSEQWCPDDAKQWDSFKPNTTDYRVIFTKAQAAGWVNPLSKPKTVAVSTPTPATLSAADLMNMQFREIKWCVQDILPEGTYLLSAKPKVGKSWLALQIALAIVKGTQSLGKQCESGSALVLALEDNQRRLQSRLARLGAFIFPDMERLKKLEVATEWPRVNEGGSEKIEQWIVANPDARLVVIDTLAKFRPTTAGRASAYEQDYEAMAPLKALSDKYNVTILIVTHNRKMSSDDPLDTISGTMGLSGGCDGALIIDRQRGNNDATLHLIGRDIENDGAFSIRFQKDSCTWEMLGGSEEITASKSRDFLLRLFKDEGRPLTPKEVAELTGRPSSTVRRLLSEMVKSGNLEKSDIGVYHLPGDPPIKGEHPEQGEQCEQGEHYVHTLTVTPKPIRRAVEEEIETL